MLVHEVIACGESSRLAFLGKQTVTYEDLRQWVNAYRDFFYESGVKTGDKVGLIAKNSAEFIYCYMAISSLGAVVVPLNYQLVAREVAYVVKDADIRLLVMMNPLDLDEDLLSFGYTAPVTQLIIPDFAPGLTTKGNSEAPVPDITPDQVCVIIYTSGTTGYPKGAVLTHANLIDNAKNFSPVIDLNASCNALCVLPMYHCFAWTCAVLASLLNGCAITILDVFAPKETLAAIRDLQVTHIYAVPPMYSLFNALGTPEDLATVKFFVSGGSALPQVIAEQFYGKFGQQIMQGYGLSEASPVVAVNPPGRVKHGSIGLPIPGVEIRIVATDSRPAAIREVGELTVRGTNVMQGYHNLPGETAYALRDGWLHTGDLAYQDEDGYFVIVDRLKDMIIASGENIYPREVEELLYTHPAIAEAAVIGVPDKLRGQAVCAYVVLKEGFAFNPKDLKEYLQSKLAPYKMPKEFIQLASLPKNSTGKILKTALRDQADRLTATAE